MKFGSKAVLGSKNKWGTDSGTFDDEFCADSRDRLLVQMRDGPNVIALVCELVRRWGLIANVAEDVKNAFDLDTAVGQQQDVIGRIIDLPRLGFSDDIYRKLQSIQALLVLRSNGTGNAILKIARTYVGPGPSISTHQFFPAFFQLDVAGMTIDELDALLAFRFIPRARFGGVGAHLAALPVDALIIDDPTTPIVDPGVIDDPTTPIVGAEPITPVFEV